MVQFLMIIYGRGGQVVWWSGGLVEWWSGGLVVLWSGLQNLVLDTQTVFDSPKFSFRYTNFFALFETQF